MRKLTIKDLERVWDLWRDKYVAPWREGDGRMRVPIRYGFVDFKPHAETKLDPMPVALFIREFRTRADGKRVCRFRGEIEGTDIWGITEEIVLPDARVAV